MAGSNQSPLLDILSIPVPPIGTLEAQPLPILLPNPSPTLSTFNDVKGLAEYIIKLGKMFLHAKELSMLLAQPRGTMPPTCGSFDGLGNFAFQNYPIFKNCLEWLLRKHDLQEMLNALYDVVYHQTSMENCAFNQKFVILMLNVAAFRMDRILMKSFSVVTWNRDPVTGRTIIVVGDTERCLCWMMLATQQRSQPVTRRPEQSNACQQHPPQPPPAHQRPVQQSFVQNSSGVFRPPLAQQQPGQYSLSSQREALNLCVEVKEEVPLRIKQEPRQFQ